MCFSCLFVRGEDSARLERHVERDREQDEDRDTYDTM